MAQAPGQDGFGETDRLVCIIVQGLATTKSCFHNGGSQTTRSFSNQLTHWTAAALRADGRGGRVTAPAGNRGGVSVIGYDSFEAKQDFSA